MLPNGWGASYAIAPAVLAACAPANLDAIEPGDLTSDLIAHYTFDEDGGTVVHDYSPGGNLVGALVSDSGTSLWLPDGGRFGGALHFDGESYVSVDSFPWAVPNFTVSTWLRWNGAMDAVQTVLSTEVVFDGGWQINAQEINDSGFEMQAAFADPALADASLGDDYRFLNAPLPEAGAWTHFAFVVDETPPPTLTIYLNGNRLTSTSAPNPIRHGTPNLLMGRWSQMGRFLVGDLDDVTIYQRALQATEIADLYHAPLPAPLPDQL
ncbi:MAG: LamG domain-containing protein [Polyangiaceae bacterium]|jgi:hypothetical protein